MIRITLIVTVTTSFITLCSGTKEMVCYRDVCHVFNCYSKKYHKMMRHLGILIKSITKETLLL